MPGFPLFSVHKNLWACNVWRRSGVLFLSHPTAARPTALIQDPFPIVPSFIQAPKVTELVASPGPHRPSLLSISGLYFCGNSNLPPQTILVKPLPCYTTSHRNPKLFLSPHHTHSIVWLKCPKQKAE